MKKLNFIRDLIPFNIGSFIKDLYEKNETPERTLNREQAFKHLLKFIIYGALIYMVASGKISIEDAKELIN